MGDVITRFRLETTQFDSKLRDSAKALQNIAHQAQLGGKDFNDFSQKAIETARALGTVQSGANNTKDKLRDLVGSYNDAAKAYNSLSETAKQGEFGKAMAESLNQLQVRIKETKEELYGLGDAMKGKGSDLFGGEGFKGMLQVFGGNLMTKAAEYVAQLGSEVIEITKASGELAKEAEGVTRAFERLGRPGLLDELKAATHDTVSEFELMKAAVQFNDFKLPLSELGTMLAFAQQKAKDTGQSVDYMVSSIVTGLGRKSLMILDNLGLSASEVKDRMKETGDMTKAVGEIIREQMEKAGDYVDTASDKASRANAKLQDEMLALGNAMKETFGISSIDDFATAIKTEVVGAITFTIETINEAKLAWKGLMEMMGVSSPASQPQGYFKKGAVMPNGTYVEQTDRDGNVRGGYWNNGEIAWNSAGVEIVGSKRDNTKTPKTGGSTKKVPTMQDFNLQMTKNDLLIQDQKAAGDLVKDMPSPYQMMFDEIKKQYLDKKDFDYGKDISKEWKVDSKGNLTNKPETRAQESMARDLNKFTGYAEKTLGGVSSIVGGLSQLGVEIPKGLQDVISGIQGVTSIVTGIASLVAMIEALTTVQTTESTIKSIPIIGWALAGGGIVHAAGGYEVPGNYYSGDQVPALLNSGELVLNKAQQNTLANELQGNGMQNMRLRTEVSGRNLIVVIENDLKARGKGQLATFK